MHCISSFKFLQRSVKETSASVPVANCEAIENKSGGVTFDELEPKGENFLVAFSSLAFHSHNHLLHTQDELWRDYQIQ